MVLSLLGRLFPARKVQESIIVPEVKERVPTAQDSTLEKEVITGRIVQANSREGYLAEGNKRIPAIYFNLTIEGSKQHSSTYPYSNLKQFEKSETSEGTFKVDSPAKYQKPTGLFEAYTTSPQKVARSFVGKNVVYTKEALRNYIPGEDSFFSLDTTYHLRFNSGKLKGRTFSEKENRYPL